jgi:hypothetical protein
VDPQGHAEGALTSDNAAGIMVGGSAAVDADIAVEIGASIAVEIAVEIAVDLIDRCCGAVMA